QAQAAMDADALFAVGADADVSLEIVLFVLAEVSVEEEVSNPFHIVTDHYSGSPWQSGGDDSATKRNWRGAERIPAGSAGVSPAVERDAEKNCGRDGRVPEIGRASCREGG